MTAMAVNLDRALADLRKLAAEIPADARYLATLEAVCEGLSDPEELRDQMSLVEMLDGSQLAQMLLANDLSDILARNPHYAASYAHYRRMRSS